MKNFTLGFLIVTLLFFVFGFSKSCHHKERTVRINAAIELPPLPLKNAYVTPKGVPVGSVNPIPAEFQTDVLNDVDAGIEKMLQTTEKYNAPNARSFTDYSVLIKPKDAETSDGNICPALLMKSGQKVAGTVFGLGLEKDIPTPIIIVAENFNPSASCKNYGKETIRFEGEHIFACHNQQLMSENPNLSICNYYQGENDKHPIFPD